MKPGKRAVRGLLAACFMSAFVALVIAVADGFAFQIGRLPIRAHNPVRAAIVAAILATAALTAGRSQVRAALEWWWGTIERFAQIFAAMLAIVTVLAGLAWGTFVAGGSDSYCYLNQAELFARGQARDFEPLATDPAWPGTFWSFVPAGHTPARDQRGYFVPICPPGYPLVLAGARLLFGRTAMFWVTPLLGGLAVYLAFLLGSRLAGPATGLMTAVLTASSPTFLAQLVQPMNDVPAAALWCAALVTGMCWSGRQVTGALVSGLLTGIALTIRPNLAPLAAVTGLAAAWLPPVKPISERVTTMVAFGLATAPGILVVMAVQNAMYGSPVASGYGDLSALFSLSNVMPNLQRYPAWLMRVHTPLIAAALASPFVLAGQARRRSIWILAFVAVTFACYLPYVVFDAWWYTRFLLPAIPPLLALAAAVAVRLVQRMPAPARAMPFAGACGILLLSYVAIAVHRDAFRAQAFEARFRSAGEYVARLPPNAAFITGHQSGSVRFYSGRSTAGWGDIEPGRLDEALEFLRRHGRKPYFLFEAWEEPLFKERFPADRLGTLEWAPTAVIDDVRIYDPADRDRGERR
jgi:Oligosaccharyl transferase STT3, N-terminal